MRRTERHRATGGDLDRRRFLTVTAGGVVTGILLTSCSQPGTRLWRFFTAEEVLTLDAVAEQVIPSDDLPGGRAAGVSTYIDRQLISYYRHWQQRYRQGLQALQATSHRLAGQEFERLSFAEQARVLTAMERNEVPPELWEQDSPAAFFNLVRDHCLQGYYGTPRHGGNRDLVGYRLVGMDYPQLVGRVKT